MDRGVVLFEGGLSYVMHVCLEELQPTEEQHTEDHGGGDASGDTCSLRQAEAFGCHEYVGCAYGRHEERGQQRDDKVAVRCAQAIR